MPCAPLKPSRVHGSVAQAVEELNVTAGAVSRMVKCLEEDLGIRLLEREGRGITLTDTAESLATRLQVGFQELKDAVSGLRGAGLERALSVGMEPVFASGCWSPVWTSSAGSHPRSTPRGRGPTSPSIKALPTADGPDQIKLIEERIFAVYSPQALSRHTLLHYEDAPASWQWPSRQEWFQTLGVNGINASRGLRMVADQAIMDAARSG